MNLPPKEKSSSPFWYMTAALNKFPQSSEMKQMNQNKKLFTILLPLLAVPGIAPSPWPFDVAAGIVSPWG